MWDVRVLWEHLKTDFWSQKTAIKLRTRAIILIRMSAAARNGDATHIHRPSITWTSKSVSFRYFQWKTDRFSGRKYSRRIHVKKLPPENLHMCAYRALRAYMSYHVRDYEKSNHEYVWLHYNGSTHVQAAVLAADTSKLMGEAGIGKEFKSGSIRHAMITFWRRCKVPIESVMDRTGHRSKRLVLTFYDLSEIDGDITAEMVCQGESSDEEMELELRETWSNHSEANILATG
jgi:hypothetical protein